MDLTAPNLNFVDFSHENNYLCVGSQSGFHFVNLNSLQKKDTISIPTTGGIGITQMRSSKVAVVCSGGDKPEFSKYIMKIYNIDRGYSISEIKVNSPIVKVKVNRQRMIVMTEKTIEIFDDGIKNIHSIPVENTHVVALSSTSLIAYQSTVGSIDIFDAINLRKKTTIKAHDGPIAALSFDHQGQLIASASDKGTLIRVFRVEDGQNVMQFRRGSYKANISTISFTKDSNYICTSSDSDTIHIFKLSLQGPSYLWSMVDYFLPKTVHDMVDPQWSFAQIPVKADIYISTILDDSPTSKKVVTIGKSGIIQTFSMDGNGECKPLETCHLQELI